MSEAKNQTIILKDIINSSWNGIGIIDFNSELKFVNEAFAPILGYKKDDILKRKLTDFMLPKYKKSFLELLEQNIQNRYINKLHIGCLRGDNKTVYLEIVVNLMSSQKLFVINISDITAEITEKNLVNKFVVQYKLDKDGYFISASEAFYKISGYTKEDILNKHCEEILSNNLESNIKDDFLSSITHGKNWNGRLIFLKKDSMEIYVDYMSNSIKNKYGDIIGYNAAMIDVTGEVLLKKSKDNLQKRVVDNEERLKIMSETMRTVAHEWRQPLNTISLTAQNLMLELEFSDEVNKENIKHILEDVQNKTQELSNVIASFQQVVEIKGSKKKRNIKDIISEAIKMVDLYDKDYLIEEHSQTQAFRTYPKELISAISAILKNAIEATISKANKFIKIQTYEQDNNIIVKISNNGGNIPDDIIDKIFLPYFSTKEERNGVGLGLYITKTIIELHLKGNIDVINKLDDIVEFTISLPMGALE